MADRFEVFKLHSYSYIKLNAENGRFYSEIE